MLHLTLLLNILFSYKNVFLRILSSVIKLTEVKQQVLLFTQGVNFINVSRKHFLYERLFDSFSLVTCKWKKLPKSLSYIKFACKMLMKLTREVIVEKWPFTFAVRSALSSTRRWIWLWFDLNLRRKSLVHEFNLSFWHLSCSYSVSRYFSPVFAKVCNTYTFFLSKLSWAYF